MNCVPASLRSGLMFLRTGLETGRILTFIAEQAIDEPTIKRTREKARWACRSVQHFMNQIPLPDHETAELRQKLKALDNRLRTLEELTTPNGK